MTDDPDATAPNAPLEAPFDPKAAIAELVGSTANVKSRKLPFWEQCAAFYATYNRMPPRVVAKAFGISTAAVSQIAGCLHHDPRPTVTELVPERIKTPIRDGTVKNGVQTGHIVGYESQVTGGMIEVAKPRDPNANRRSPNRLHRYRRVAEKFITLGEEEFAARYYTPMIHERLMKVKYDLDGEATRRARRGADPAADSHAGPFKDPGDYDCAIVWLEDPNGWYIQGPHMSFGREQLEGGARRGFQTSKQAYEAAFR